MTLDRQIEAALHQVCDPCSIAANAPLSIIDMGLVREWSVDDTGNVVVTMCVTSPSCTMAPHMVRGAEQVLSQIVGVRSARVEIDPAVLWSPDDMTGSGKAVLEERRAQSQARTPVQPQQWRRNRETMRQQA